MKKPTKTLISILKVIMIFSLPLAIFLSSLQYYAFNKDFYLQEFIKYDVIEYTKINYEDLGKITDKLISYLKDEEDNLDIRVSINGNVEEVFGEREKLHMIDVKGLFVKGYSLKSTSIIISIMSALLIILYSKTRKKDIFQGLLWVGIIPLVLMVILFILIKTDFYKYFTYFHEIFFTNDLWLLNPNTDVLIQMLPLGFFTDITIRVLFLFSVISILLIGISWTGLNHFKLRRFRK